MIEESRASLFASTLVGSVPPLQNYNINQNDSNCMYHVFFSRPGVNFTHIQKCVLSKKQTHELYRTLSNKINYKVLSFPTQINEL